MALTAIERLGQTLLIVLAIQLCGYVFKRSQFMPADRAAGMGFFIANLSLPCLLFRSIATLDLSVLDFSVIASIAITKVIVTLMAVMLGFVATKRDEAPGTSLTRSGLYCLAVTMSDDMALGLPLLGALFPKQSPMLYVISAMQ